MKIYVIPLLLLLSLGTGLAQSPCIVFPQAPATLPVNDLSANDGNLWWTQDWYDPLNQTHDMCDALINTAVSAYDTCGGSISMRFLLYLDLDRDGAWETVLKSWELPTAGFVNFNNINNPNFNGGDAREFDNRPVAANDKYQFAIETTQNGDTTRAQLRWNTANAPGTYVNPQLPHGTHKIKWIVENDLGNNAAYEYLIVVKDGQDPTVVCLNGLSVNIMPTGMITVWTADFLQYAEDNASASLAIQYAVREADQGTGFPTDANGNPITSLTFDCDQLGVNSVELWAKDASGNAAFCETYIIVQDNIGNCPGGGGGAQAPSVTCINGLSVNILPTGQVTLWATDFLSSVIDDTTPSGDIDLGLRFSGTGNTFPVDGLGNPIDYLTLTCSDLGTQFVQLWARDAEGNADYCETYLYLSDNFGNCPGGGGSESPTVVCLNGLAANIMPTGLITLWASDFIQYAQDDNTPFPQLQFGLRECGFGFGFPVDVNGNPEESITFDCMDLGTKCVEVWVRDQDGNAEYCETYALIQDNMDNCSGGQPAEISVCITAACNNSPIFGVDPGLGGGTNDAVDDNGCGIFPYTVQAGSNITVIPTKPLEPSNGVSVLDLIKIKHFILGVDNDLSPYALIAADANKSGNITGFDIINLRRLLLGVYSELPNNTSWRFVDANFNFPNPQNPFQTVFPETISLPNVLAGNSYQVAFKAIKVGDLDCDAWQGLGAPAGSRDFPQQQLSLPDMTLLPGQTYDLALRLNEAGDWSGIQFALQFDPGQVALLGTYAAGNIAGLDNEAFANPRPGEVRMVWLPDQAQHIGTETDLLLLRVKANTACKVSEVFQRSKGLESLGSLNGTPQVLQLTWRNDRAAGLGQATAVFAPQPNPTHDGTRISLYLQTAEQVNCTISDLSGRVLWSATQAINAGSAWIDIPAESMPQTGVYLWKVKAGDVTAAGKLVKTAN